MTLPKENRLDHSQLALIEMVAALGDEAFDTKIFDPAQSRFSATLRGTWQELLRSGLVADTGQCRFRLTPKGWLAGLELSGTSKSGRYLERVGRVLAAMKQHAKAQTDSALIPLRELSAECQEPEGFVFNLIESGSSTTGPRTAGAHWYRGEKGRLIEIPADFSLEPIDLISALTLEHYQRIEELETRPGGLERDRE